MKKSLIAACAAAGACWISFGAKELDTGGGILFFALGLILLAGAWSMAAKEMKKEKNAKNTKEEP